jgi:hypothetical protein
MILQCLALILCRLARPDGSKRNGHPGFNAVEEEWFKAFLEDYS